MRNSSGTVTVTSDVVMRLLMAYPSRRVTTSRVRPRPRVRIPMSSAEVLKYRRYGESMPAGIMTLTAARISRLRTIGWLRMKRAIQRQRSRAVSDSPARTTTRTISPTVGVRSVHDRSTG